MKKISIVFWIIVSFFVMGIIAAGCGPNPKHDTTISPSPSATLSSSPSSTPSSSTSSTPSPSVTSTPTSTPFPTPLGWWKFEGNGNDSTATGLNLTLKGTTGSYDLFGESGEGFKSSDGKSYFQQGTTGVDDPPFNQMNGNQFSQITVEGWIKLDTLVSSSSGSSGKAYIIQKASTASPYAGFNLYVNGADNKVNFYVYPNGTNNKAVSNTTITTGQWYYIVGTFDGQYIRLYINGTLENTYDFGSNVIVSGSGLGDTTGKNLKVAGGATSSVQGFVGTVDEVRIYNVALTGTQIQYRYNNLSSTSFTSPKKSK